MMGCVFDSPNWATNDLSVLQLSTGQLRNVLSWVIISYIFPLGSVTSTKCIFLRSFSFYKFKLRGNRIDPPSRRKLPVDKRTEWDMPSCRLNHQVTHLYCYTTEVVCHPWVTIDLPRKFQCSERGRYTPWDVRIFLVKQNFLFLAPLGVLPE